MWKHNSKGLNSIGDYDYYVYEEEWRNPRNFKLDGEKTILFSLFSSFDSGFKAYYYCMEQLLESLAFFGGGPRGPWQKEFGSLKV